MAPWLLPMAQRLWVMAERLWELAPRLWALGLLTASVVVLGVTNRVLYKMVSTSKLYVVSGVHEPTHLPHLLQTLVPMREYVFFLAQFMTLSYVAVYFRCAVHHANPNL
jgi:hypothetical protein